MKRVEPYLIAHVSEELTVKKTGILTTSKNILYRQLRDTENAAIIGSKNLSVTGLLVDLNK